MPRSISGDQWDLFQSGGNNTSRLNLETGERTVFGGRYFFLAAIEERMLVQLNGGARALFRFESERFEVREWATGRSSDDSYDFQSVVVEGSDVWIAVELAPNIENPVSPVGGSVHNLGQSDCNTRGRRHRASSHSHSCSRRELPGSIRV